MKYLVMLCDGMADYPIDALDGKTPLEAAETPCMDKLAETAKVGLVKTVADGMKPGSDVAKAYAGLAKEVIRDAEREKAKVRAEQCR